MIKKVNLENFDIKTRFSVPEQRENLTSGESINKSFGKIEKVIEDLKDVAFSGDYNDLINKPKPGTGSGGNANIDDTAISTDSTWSSDKIHKADQITNAFTACRPSLKNKRQKAVWLSER